MRLAVPHRDIRFVDELQGECIFNLAVDCGDFIVRRSDRSWAYQLAVVVDDADMGITSVVRGADLLQSTASQTFLAELLGKEAPSYCHVPVLLGSDGKRIAKRHSHASIEELIASHKTPEAILGAIAHATGITSDNRPQAASELLESANLDALYGKREILVGDALST